MTVLKKRRKRGIYLTAKGLQAFKNARIKSENEHNFGKRYTAEELSELTKLDIHTIKRVLDCEKGSDKNTVESLFSAFGLELAKDYYRQPNPNQRQNWGEAISVSDFLGRMDELTELEEWILKDRCRLVAILGMGGMGKTSLSVKFAQQIQDKFDFVVWRSLRDAPSLEKLLTDIIQFISDEQVTDVNLSQSIGRQISCLINYLHSSRCLLIFDNLESILRSNGNAGLFREGYEEYGELLRRLGETEHQSCLLMTSREKPDQIAGMEGTALLTRTLRLKGLKHKEAEEILKAKGINGSETEINNLLLNYEGNALALKIVGTTILDLFGGNITEFLREKIAVFGAIRNLLDQQFNRLSPSEQEIIYWLAINREPTTLSQLREDMVSTIPRLNLIEGLESLSRRSLIEYHVSGYTLQSVVMEYILVQFIQTVSREINTLKPQFFRWYVLVKATAKDYVREAQIRLILQPVIDELLSIFRCSKNIEKRLSEILAMQREISPRESGYTAGNIINLLCQMETDLTGYDFSNLCVWQADLRQAQLHQVNFQNADLSKSVFAENFGGIWSVAFSPDGQYLAAGDTKGDIILRGVPDGQLIRSFEGHNGWVVSLAFSPDGNTLASGSCDCKAKLWDVHTGQCLNTLEEHEHEVWSVAFSPDGETLASGCDDCKVRLWSVNSAECLKVFRGHANALLSVVFSLDGKKLLTGSHDNTIKLWDIETIECKRIFQGHKDGVRSVSVSPNGQMLASGSSDRTVRLWDIETGECLKVFQGHFNGIWTVVFSPEGNFLASGSIDHTVRLWDIETGECLKVFQGHSNWINSVAFSPKDNILASGSYDQSVKLWNFSSYQCFKTFQGYNNQALSVAFSPNGRMLASGGRDHKVRLWDIETGKIVKTLYKHDNWVLSVAFSVQGNLLASSSADKTITLWDVSTGKLIKTFFGHKAIVRSIVFSPDDQTLASASEDRTIRLWDIKTGQTLKTLTDHQAEIWSIAFSSDGQKLASGSFDGTAKLWNIHTGKCFKTLDEHLTWVLSVAFSSDNKTLATTSPDQSIRLWNIHTGKCKAVLHEDRGYSQLVAFSRDDLTIASYNQDHDIKLWNVSTLECFKSLHGHTSLINSIAFSPDGQTLASSSEDETLKLWHFKTGECIKTLKIEKPYQFMNITGVTSLNEVILNTLKGLGGVEGG